MRVFTHRLLLALAALAFFVGIPLALAIPPTLAAQPCPHEHHAMGGGAHEHHYARAKQQHQHDAAGCLCCCMGVGVGMPDLARGPVTAVPLFGARIVYPDAAAQLAGRSLRPDLGPPRPSALS